MSKRAKKSRTIRVTRALTAMSHRLMAGIAVTTAALVVLVTAVSAAGPAGPEQAKLFASDATTAVGFGVSVAISGDTALVSSLGIGPLMGAEGQPTIELASVYVFVRTGTVWTEQAKLIASDAAAGDRFGSSVAISGNTALIGAWGDDDAGTDSGSAYVFRRTGTTWTEQAKLTASDAAAGDRFGSSVAISANTALIGATGAAYVFTPDVGSMTTYPLGGSTSWAQQTKLAPSDPSAGFGLSVATSGNTAVVGAWVGDAASSIPGSAHVFTRVGSNWTEQTKLTASFAVGAEGVGFSEWFGGSVAMSGDTVLIGSGLDDDVALNSGAAYVFVPPIDEKPCETSKRSPDSSHKVKGDKKAQQDCRPGRQLSIALPAGHLDEEVNHVKANDAA